jgi:hypothetical protein
VRRRIIHGAKNIQLAFSQTRNTIVRCDRFSKTRDYLPFFGNHTRMSPRRTRQSASPLIASCKGEVGLRHTTCPAIVASHPTTDSSIGHCAACSLTARHRQTTTNSLTSAALHTTSALTYPRQL